VPRTARREAVGVPRRAAVGVPRTARREAVGVLRTARREAVGVPRTARREAVGVPRTARREAVGVPRTARREAVDDGASWAGGPPYPPRLTTSLHAAPAPRHDIAAPAPRHDIAARRTRPHRLTMRRPRPAFAKSPDCRHIFVLCAFLLSSANVRS
jgi:hypothetical protein